MNGIAPIPISSVGTTKADGSYINDEMLCESYCRENGVCTTQGMSRGKETEVGILMQERF
jgi:hypothetical protein